MQVTIRPAKAKGPKVYGEGVFFVVARNGWEPLDELLAPVKRFSKKVKTGDQ